MTRPVDPARVASRSLLATVEVTALAAVAHVVAGGRLPTPGFLLAFAATVFGCAVLTLARYLRVATVVPFVLVAQVALHAALDGVHAHAGHDAGHDAGLVTLSVPMLGAHLVTAVVSAIVLLIQEQVLAAVVAAVRLPGPSAPVPGAPLAVRASTHVRQARWVLLATSPRRGPPRARCATS